jgi:hypothetical protein
MWFMPPKRPDPSTYPTLNAAFYDAAPWQYFEQRMAHLMLVASDRDRYRAAFAATLSFGPVRLEVAAPETDGYPTPEQAFTAIEAEVLLHHTAETLLRFVHAHADPDESCPWLRMSALTSARNFKDWVRKHVAKAPRDQLAELCSHVFACDLRRPEDLQAYLSYARLLAEHFLDAGPYNAAKHGMGLTGGSERREIAIGELAVFRRDGAVVNWLTAWPLGDPAHPPQWTRASRLFSPEAAIALVSVATNLMKSLWIRGRAEHLGEPYDEVFRPPSPDDLFEAFGVRHHVLADWYEPLRSNNEAEQKLIIQTRHLEPPQDASA